MEEQKFQMDFAGRPLVIEVGKLAKQASGAALVRYGDTAVFVTATGSKEAREDADFFPLTVDYEEKMYSVGKIPGGFIKREGKPPESATLFARLIDRPIRPLFPKTYRHDVHVVAYDFCVDHDNAPEIAAMIGASVSLCMSHIPFAGPIAGVRVGRVDGQFVINPTVAQSEQSDMDIVVAGTKDAILMVEGGAHEIPEEQVLDAIMFAHEEIKKVVEFQLGFLDKISVPKQEFVEKEPPADIVEAVHAYGEEAMKTAIFTADKVEREEKMDAVETDIYEHFADIYPDNADDVAEITQKMIKEIVRMIMGEKEPTDGHITLGSRVHIGYFAQEHTDLHGAWTVLDEIMNDFSYGEEEARSVLGRFMFRGDDVFKVIDSLSGGEQARLALLKLFLQGPNFLILDEPTNHLDIPTREVLEQALLDFGGTYLVVSHDRYFLDKITQRTLVLEHKQLTEYVGNYSYYREKVREAQEAAEKVAAEAQGSSQAQEKAAAPAVKKAEPAPAVKAPAKAPAYGQAAKLEKIEMKIAELEATIKMYEVQMNMPQNQTDADAMMELTKEYEAAQAQLDEAYEKWEALSES